MLIILHYSHQMCILSVRITSRCSKRTSKMCDLKWSIRYMYLFKCMVSSVNSAKLARLKGSFLSTCEQQSNNMMEPIYNAPPPHPNPRRHSTQTQQSTKEETSIRTVSLCAYLCAYTERRLQTWCVRHVLTYLGSSFRSNELVLTFLIFFLIKCWRRCWG